MICGPRGLDVGGPGSGARGCTGGCVLSSPRNRSVVTLAAKPIKPTAREAGPTGGADRSSVRLQLNLTGGTFRGRRAGGRLARSCATKRVCAPSLELLNDAAQSIGSAATSAVASSKTSTELSRAEGLVDFHRITDTAGAEVDLVIQAGVDLLAIGSRPAELVPAADARQLNCLAPEYPDCSLPGVPLYRGDQTYWLTRDVLAVPQ